ITSFLYSVFTIGHYCNNKKNIIISRFAGVSMVYINALIAADISDKLSILLLITITVIPLLLSSYLLFKETKINGYMSRKAAWLTGLALSTLPTFPCLLIYIFNDGAVNTNLTNDIAFPYALTALAETIILFILQILKTNTENRTTFIKDNFEGIQAGILVSSFIHSPSIIILREHFRYSESNLELFTVILLISLMTLWALLYRYELRIISVIATVYASYAFVNWFRFEYRSPMLLIPIVLFSISVACDRKRSVNKDSIFYGILAVSASMLFLDSKTNIYALAAFIITEIVYFIRSNSKKDKTRAISLLAVTLSAVVWFKLPFSPYADITDIVQLKLLPPTLFFILLPFIITRLNEHRELSIRIRIIYGYILMAVLAGIAIDSGKISDRLIYAVICVVILVAGFFFHSRQTVVLGTVSTVFLIVYLIGQVFGSRAWLIYLAVSGTVLISVAVRNEIKRRKS
ncbi:MAG: hypothetical protein MJ153_08835, partial [Clostridia bacterium]|nr:hypothetical protein [Clostridia bacterium]